VFGYVWYELRYFIQRGWYGVSDYDAWSLYNYVARVMANGLPAISLHGYPGRYTPEEWAARLRTMQEFFKIVADESDPDLEDSKAPEALQMFAENFYDLWD
jgi:hypothetical protein